MLKFKNDGFTLVELMVALTINAFIFVALIAIFSANLTHYHKVMNANRLNQQLEATLQLMSTEIRRAGYWSNAQNDIGGGANNNPFMASGADISINGSNNCILFTYDRNANGSLPAIDVGYDDERYGFRLNNQVIQTRPPGAPFSCTAAANAWENVTDTNLIRITGLTFTLTSRTVPVGATSGTVSLRSVDISITGQLANDSSVTKTLTQHVRIRNDKYNP